jgi:hypothetical protein
MRRIGRLVAGLFEAFGKAISADGQVPPGGTDVTGGDASRGVESATLRERCPPPEVSPPKADSLAQGAIQRFR